MSMCVRERVRVRMCLLKFQFTILIMSSSSLVSLFDSILSPMIKGTGASRNPRCEDGSIGTKTWGHENGNKSAVIHSAQSMS